MLVLRVLRPMSGYNHGLSSLVGYEHRGDQPLPSAVIHF